MVLRNLLRIRRLHLGVFLLALIPMLYFFFRMHTNVSVRAVYSTSAATLFRTNDQRHIKFVPSQSRVFSKQKSESRKGTVVLSDVKNAIKDNAPSEGKHYKLFKEFSQALSRLHGLHNLTKTVKDDLAERVKRVRTIRVPAPPKVPQFRSEGKDIERNSDADYQQSKIYSMRTFITTTVSSISPDINRRLIKPTRRRDQSMAETRPSSERKATGQPIIESVRTDNNHDIIKKTLHPYSKEKVIKLGSETNMTKVQPDIKQQVTGVKVSEIKPQVDQRVEVKHEFGKVIHMIHDKKDSLDDLVPPDIRQQVTGVKVSGIKPQVDQRVEVKHEFGKVINMIHDKKDSLVTPGRDVTQVKTTQERRPTLEKVLKDRTSAGVTPEMKNIETTIKSDIVRKVTDERSDSKQKKSSRVKNDLDPKGKPYMVKVKVIRPTPALPTRMRTWREREKDLNERLSGTGARKNGDVGETRLLDTHPAQSLNSDQKVELPNSDDIASAGSLHNKDTAGDVNKVAISPPRPTARPKTCNHCFQPTFSYVTNPKHICHHAEDSILVLLMVFSEHSHRNKRSVIRESWGSVTHKNVGVVRLVFVLGDIEDTGEKAETQRESAQYGDILMGDFKDSFRNLTLKTVLSLGWATRYCSRAKYLMKTDDDMWVNIPLFLSIESGYSLDQAVGGTCWQKQWRPHRQDDKYHVTELEYPQEFYPPLCVGTAYVMSLQTATDIYRVHPNIPFFHLEDVYVALCREYLGYNVVPIPGFFNNKAPYSICQYRTKIVTSHWVTESEMREAWTMGCFIEPKDPIVDFFTGYPQVPAIHPRHQIQEKHL